jgi:hypothetical protein
MKRIVLWAILLNIFMAHNVKALPWWCDCYGGFDEDFNYWYLQDYGGYPLETGDWAYVAWTGPDEEIDPPDLNGYPTGDDAQLGYDPSMGFIYYGTFTITVTTWAVGDLDSLGQQRRPAAGDLIYCRIFDDPQGYIGPGNYYGDSQTYQVQNTTHGEEFFCLFPGDPGYGHTDTPIGPTAVELMSFEAFAMAGGVQLRWKTASETNNFGFHIDRSQDGVIFQRITGKVITGAGNSETENRYVHVDRALTNGVTYYYNLISVDVDGLEQVANESPVSATPAANVPEDFFLRQNYPNPFNPVTEITYAIPRDECVILKIYNVLGAEVATLVDDNQEAGFYTVGWDAEGLASGVYFCTLSAGDFQAIKKMVLLK